MKNSNVFKNISKLNQNIKDEINQKKAKSKDEKKSEKEKRLLEEGFKLFTNKGIKETSVQDIVDNANVAKGTFYLYFKDKYELRDILIMKKSQKLFSDAAKKLSKESFTNFSDKLIFIIDCVIDELTKNPLLLQLISKDLSFGIFNKTIIKLSSNEQENNDKKEDSSKENNVKKEESIYDLFLKGIKEDNLKLKNPEVTLFMIIELVSSTCFASILYKEPLPIDKYKPFLYEEIRNMLKNG